MENGKQGAFAMLDSNGKFTQYGLTKREYFAAMAMQGLCANNAMQGIAIDVIATESLIIADALLDELDKTE